MYEVIPARSDLPTLSQFPKTLSAGEPGDSSAAGYGSPAYAVTLSGGSLPALMETAGSYIGSMVETLSAKLEEFFADFAEQVRDFGVDAAAGKASYAFEASAHASMRLMIEETSVTASGNGQVIRYQSRSVSIEAEIDIRVSAYRQVSSESLAMDSDYFSPENTSQRIVDFASGFFASYKNRHPEISPEEAAESYGELVRNAVDDGFREALALLGTLPGSILDTVMETYDLVMRMIDEMFAPLAAG